MKAAIFSEQGGPEVIRVAEVETPEPGPGEVRIAVRAAAMNHLDLWARRGMPGITLPHIGGADVAGNVDRPGSGVDVAEGVRVVVDPSLHYETYDTPRQGPAFPQRSFGLLGEHHPGGFAEYVVVPAGNLLEMPEEVSFDEAAASALVSVTAWRGLVVRGGMRPGERVLVTGASGGVSTMAVQIARLGGAVVYAVTSGAERCARVKELGADFVYDRLRVDYSREVRGDTDGEGVDLVFDSVGEALWDQNLRALGAGGRLVTYGATTGARGITEIRRVFWKQLSILGSTMGSPAEFRTVMSLVFAGDLKPVIDRVLSLGEVRRGHELLEAGEVFGKLVVHP